MPLHTAGDSRPSDSAQVARRLLRELYYSPYWDVGEVAATALSAAAPRGAREPACGAVGARDREIIP